MSSSSPPSKLTLRVVDQSPAAAQPASSPRFGDLPPEVMWQAYNHAMLLMAKDLRWRKERDKQKRRDDDV